ncbi:MAG TPA: M28 family peptidase [Gemmatirosa sp.]
MRRLLLLALALAAAGAAHAQPTVWPDEGPRTWTPRPTVTAITANDLRTRLYQLADDSMQGRRIGEIGNYRATAYIAGEFQRLGLRPAGDDGTYFQALPIGPGGFDVAAARLSVSGAALTPRTDWIPTAPSAANGLSGAVDLANVPTVFAGRWGDTATVLDPAAFRGRVAVFVGAGSASSTRPGARGALPRCDSLPDKFGAAAAIAAEAADARAGTGRSARRPPARDPRAQAAGAVAVLVVGLDALSEAAVDAAMSPQMRMTPPTPAHAIGGALISRAAAARLFGGPVGQLAMGTTGQPVTASWRYAWHVSPTPARNVVAVLPGADPARAGEYVLVSAHNDHMGVNATAVDHDSIRAVNMVTRPQGANDPACRPSAAQQHRIDSLLAHARSIRPPRRDSIMNGADDDGSGTVVLLEIAEQFAAERPARSIVFVSHTGEEEGLLGSQWFTDHPTVPLDSIVAAHNMDMVGKGRADQVKFGGPTSVQTLGSRRLSREFGEIIDSVNAARPEHMAIDRSWDVPANPMNRFCRSDQVNYVHHDVPVTYFSTGYAEDYHQVTDEPQYIDYEHAARLGRFLHDVMAAIADRRTRPAIAGPDPAYPACR